MRFLSRVRCLEIFLFQAGHKLPINLRQKLLVCACMQFLARDKNLLSLAIKIARVRMHAISREIKSLVSCDKNCSSAVALKTFSYL